jgi:hypothetical protein
LVEPSCQVGIFLNLQGRRQLSNGRCISTKKHIIVDTSFLRRREIYI